MPCVHGRTSVRFDENQYVDDIAGFRTVGLEAARLAALHLGTDAVDLVVLNTTPPAFAGRLVPRRQVILDPDLTDHASDNPLGTSPD